MTPVVRIGLIGVGALRGVSEVRLKVCCAPSGVDGLRTGDGDCTPLMRPLLTLTSTLTAPAAAAAVFFGASAEWVRLECVTGLLEFGVRERRMSPVHWSSVGDKSELFGVPFFSAAVVGVVFFGGAFHDIVNQRKPGAKGKSNCFCYFFL